MSRELPQLVGRGNRSHRWHFKVVAEALATAEELT